MKPGVRPGSPGAHRIAEAHRGSHEHDRGGGFAANPQLAREAGKKGGAALKRKQGKGYRKYYRALGRRGGATTKELYGKPFYGGIGHDGGEIRAENFRRKIQAKGPKVA